MTKMTEMTDMTEMTEKIEKIEMTEKLLSANNLSTSRTAERHARGQKYVFSWSTLTHYKYQFESLACKWNDLFLTVQGVKLEKNHLYGY